MTSRDILEAAAAVAIGLVLAATVSVIDAYADDRRYITNENGKTIGWIEPAPFTDKLLVKDEHGRTKYVIEGRDQSTYKLRDDRGYEHRFTPRKRWGSWEERWGK